uniref:endo-polygalacturonase n=1 Tax=Lygus lineolaris TaxID=50650 RepID=A0A126CYI2_LYGLI|nr:polygalacturonase 24 [Lygus lineolaris]
MRCQCGEIALLLLMISSGVSWASNHVIRSIEDVEGANKCTNITISNLHVPAGVSLRLLGLRNAVVTFEGTITFGFKQWSGQLMMFKGDNVTVIGTPGHLIYGGGERWRDGYRVLGGPKPKFFEVRLNNSKIFGLRIRNTPMHAISINHSSNLTVSDIVVDSSEGDWKGAKRTDGFQYLRIKKRKPSRTAESPTKMTALQLNRELTWVFENNYCSGGPWGFPWVLVGGRKSNIVERVLVRNNIITNSFNGVRVKTVKNAEGRVSNVTFEDITLVNITGYGVTMVGNYILERGVPEGEPTGGVPITGLRLKNVHGSVNHDGSNFWVWVKNASDWSWQTNVTGGSRVPQCEGFPSDMEPMC